MTHDAGHINVCICTYKRPRLLERLLRELNEQETDGLFTYSIVVADNDPLQSAEPVICTFSASSPIPIKYCAQPEQNISLTRNKAIENGQGEYVAFIDDDEFPVKRWLVDLYTTCQQYHVEGVLGPVKRHFDVTPPKWVLDSKFYERQTYPTGTPVNRKEGRTGNVLLKRSILSDMDPVFRPEFRGGEDTDFFDRVMRKGCKFVWCDEAVAYEVIPPIRWNRSFMLKRALLRGAVTLKYLDFGARDIVKSAIAVPIYTLALPFALILGQHRFMDLLVRLFDHLGKLLAVIGINPIKEHYVTE
jgi:succinoglycan biosynthesis protein ExoM